MIADARATPPPPSYNKASQLCLPEYRLYTRRFHPYIRHYAPAERLPKDCRDSELLDLSVLEVRIAQSAPAVNPAPPNVGHQVQVQVHAPLGLREENEDFVIVPRAMYENREQDEDEDVHDEDDAPLILIDVVAALELLNFD